MSFLPILPEVAARTGMTQPNPFLTQGPQPFVWGQGGSRMTPQDIEFQRRLAAQQTQADFSPVGHWLQGAARLADNVAGRFREQRVEKAAERNAAESNAVLQALMSGGGSPDAVTAALTNPYVSEQVRDFAKMQWKRQNPDPLQPTEFERALRASGVMPGTPGWTEAMAKKVAATTDPMIAATLPGGRFYSGPQSGLASVMGGGDPPVSQPPGGPQPGAVVDGYRFKGGDPNKQESWEAVGGPASSAPASFR